MTEVQLQQQIREVNLLNLYRSKLATLIKKPTVDAVFKMDSKLENLITVRKLLIDDIIQAIKENNSINPNNYLNTRFYNRATKKIEANGYTSSSARFNNIIVENISRGTLDEEVKTAGHASTHYAIPALLYDMKSNFDSFYKLPAGFYILTHVSRDRHDDLQTVFKLNKPIDLQYKISHKTLCLVEQDRGAIYNLLGRLGNLDREYKYCLGSNSRNINAMMLLLGTRFGVDLLADTDRRLWDSGGYEAIFNSAFPVGTGVTRAEIETDMKKTGIINFLSEAQLEKLKNLDPRSNNYYILDY